MTPWEGGKQACGRGWESAPLAWPPPAHVLACRYSSRCLIDNHTRQLICIMVRTVGGGGWRARKGHEEKSKENGVTRRVTVLNPISEYTSTARFTRYDGRRAMGGGWCIMDLFGPQTTGSGYYLFHSKETRRSVNCKNIRHSELLISFRDVIYTDRYGISRESCYSSVVVSRQVPLGSRSFHRRRFPMSGLH